MKGHWRIYSLLAVGALFYLVYPSRIPECDAVIYASAALRGIHEMTFDPGHLGFGSLEVLATAAGRAARPPLNPVFILQYLSMAAALAGAYAFYRTLADLGVARGRATLFTATLAASYAWWHYALQAEPHMISTALLMGFLWQSCRTTITPSARSWAWSGLWLGLATLMHQKNILLVGAALPAFALATRDLRQSLRGAAAFLGVLFVVAILPYLVVGGGVLGLRTAPDFMLWIRGLSTWSAWGHWTRSTLPYTLVGIVRSLVGSHFILGLGPVRETAGRLFPRYSLEDELAIAASVPGSMGLLLLFLEAGLLGLSGLALLRRAARPGVPGPGGIPLTIFLWAWIAIVGIFAAWWAPLRAEFWLDFFPPLLVLLALPRAGGRERTGGPRILAAFALTLALVNFAGSIRPQSLAALEPESAVALALDAAVRPGDTVLSDIPFQGRASRYARAFVPVDLLGTDFPPGDSGQEVRFRMVDSLLAAAEGAHQSVYVVATPLRSGADDQVAFAGLVAALGERCQTRVTAPVRAGIDLRRITRRPGAAQ